MQLLVSVADAREARAARLGGADVIDAKNPHRGVLGAESEATLRAIRAAAGRPFSAALGDAGGTAMLARRTRIAAQLGAAYVKVGFRDVLTTAGVRARVVAALGATAARPGTHVVLVAYADWSRAGSAAPPVVLEVAAATGAAGVLLDTAYKDAALFGLWSPEMVGAWVAAVQRARLFAALAGGPPAPGRPHRRAPSAPVSHAAMLSLVTSHAWGSGSAVLSQRNGASTGMRPAVRAAAISVSPSTSAAPEIRAASAWAYWSIPRIAIQWAASSPILKRVNICRTASANGPPPGTMTSRRPLAASAIAAVTRSNTPVRLSMPPPIFTTVCTAPPAPPPPGCFRGVTDAPRGVRARRRAGAPRRPRAHAGPRGRGAPRDA